MIYFMYNLNKYFKWPIDSPMFFKWQFPSGDEQGASPEHDDSTWFRPTEDPNDILYAKQLKARAANDVFYKHSNIDPTQYQIFIIMAYMHILY